MIDDELEAIATAFDLFDADYGDDVFFVNRKIKTADETFNSTTGADDSELKNLYIAKGAKYILFGMLLVVDVDSAHSSSLKSYINFTAQPQIANMWVYGPTGSAANNYIANGNKISDASPSGSFYCSNTLLNTPFPNGTLLTLRGYVQGHALINTLLSMNFACVSNAAYGVTVKKSSFITLKKVT